MLISAQLFSYNPSEPASAAVGTVIHLLADRIETPLVEAVSEGYKKVKDADTLSAFLNQGPITETSKLMRVLKCISQEVAYPAIMKMRADMHEVRTLQMATC